MRPFAAAFLALPLMAVPALATGSIACEGVGDDVSVELTIGSLPILAIVAGQVTVSDEVWAIGEGGDHDIAVGQAFSEDGRILADFVDTNFERILVRLRLVIDREGKDDAMAGTLAVAGHGTWPVTCIGP
jgi:hypothetical protein